MKQLGAFLLWCCALSLAACSSPPTASKPPPAVIVTASAPVEPADPPPPPPQPWPCPQQADVDGDGKMDRVELTIRSAALLVGQERLPLGLPAPAVERICLADLDGDRRIEPLAVVVRSTPKDPTFRRRLFVYEVGNRRLRPEFLGTRGAGELLHAGVVDVDGDGKVEVVVRERTAAGEQTRVCGWTGFQLTERAELAANAPPYRFGPAFLPQALFSTATARLTLAPSAALSFRRTPAHAQQLRLGPGLGGAVNSARYYWLDVAARRQLGRDGFVVVEPGAAPDEFHSLYIQNQYDGVPSFVTADTALHLTHLVLDDALMRAEEEVLGPAMARLVDGMRGQGRLLRHRLGGDLERALDRVLFRLDVAAALLEGHTHGLDAPRAAAVEAELRSIEHRQAGRGPLAGVDYRGFLVRGHYTRRAALQRYFKAAMLLSVAETKGSAEAALMTALAVSDPTQRARLALLDDFGRVFVGPPASRTPLDLAASAAVAFGPGSAWTALGSKTGWERQVAPHPAKPRGSAATLLARRWPADNDLLALEPEHAKLPDPLQVFTGLGSERAKEHLGPTLQARPVLADRLGRASRALRTGAMGDRQSIGGRFLLSLRWVVLPYPEGYPAFQRSESWADHNLVTAAAAWAEWRRDTALYVQPPVVWLEGGDEDELPPGKAGFVEPVPELYAELAGVLDGVGHMMRSVGYADARWGRRGRPLLATVAASGELMQFLAEAARGELAGAGLSREQRERLSDIGPWLERVLAGDGTLRLPPVPVVADISYVKDPLGLAPDQVLTVGTGPLDVIVVAMPLGRRVVLARGAVSSFHAFPAEGPGTDEQWRAQLAAGTAPPRPPWARSVPLPRATRFAAPPKPNRRNPPRLKRRE
ncbi:MAG: DUF3160 domain-containing protein [Deltaproteobacteria bacterium]|nr:DUF3160 domain-containing protein [Deltaproteobacteria bacterium]MBW2537831.1 DUF3160 domain-containing protein [Deltaproteobacteria bacterium]